MQHHIKIALQVPEVASNHRYFSLRLQSDVYQQPFSYDLPDKLFVLCGVQADFKTFTKLLLKSTIVNKHLRWTFGSGHLVIIGDCFNEDGKGIECLWLIYSLEQQARIEGGHVHLLLGRNEITHLFGDWRHVHPVYSVGQNVSKGATALYRGNLEISKWLLTRNIIEKIGDILFVHTAIRSDDLTSLISSASGEKGSPPVTSSQVYQNIFDKIRLYSTHFQCLETEEQVDQVLRTFSCSILLTSTTYLRPSIFEYGGKMINLPGILYVPTPYGLFISRNKMYRVCISRKTDKILDWR